jgi:hypothetical protein
LLALALGMLGYGALLAPSVRVAQPDSMSDLDRLQGDWQVVAFERDGQVFPEDRFLFTRLRIQDDTIVHEGGTLGAIRTAFFSSGG